MNYYNDNEPFAAEWLRHLVGAKHIGEGIVDDRPIQEVEPSRFKKFTRCHFFAGIAGWELALQLAGWPADIPVWTGSCPCQPFSAAGKREGSKDKRDLWPVWFNLIRECLPPAIFGEQVASRLGREWLARVFADLEALGYRVAAANLCAASLGAPHIRQRLFWVADAKRQRNERWRETGILPSSSEKVEVALQKRERGRDAYCHSGSDGGLAESAGEQMGTSGQPRENGIGEGSNPWSDSIWLPCSDRNQRRTQRGIHPLAHGFPGRVGQLRAYGNSIVPQVAAVFIKAFMESML